MTYLPSPTVTIDNRDFTGRTVGAVNINRGRDTVYANPRAGYASVELIDVTDGELGFEVGAPIIVRVEDSSGNPVRLFTGVVSDWESQVVARNGQPVVFYRVQAVGPLARLNRRRIMFDGRTSETDGARVLAAVTAALPVVWEEFSSTQTWGQVAADVTWETVDPGFDADLIDPGVFDLTALPAADSGYSALAVTSDAGQSAKGVLFETPSGFIGYADADRRPANLAAGPLQVPYERVAADGLSFSSSLSDVTNRVTVEYGTDEAVTEEDTFSIGRFGLLHTTLNTVLLNEENAEARADDFLFAHSRPATELQQLTVNLRDDLPDTLRDDLLTVNTNAAVRVTGLPIKVGLGTDTFSGFVEGVRITVSDFDANLTLFVSDELLSFGSVLWGQVGATIDWQNVDAALTWADARRVTT